MCCRNAIKQGLVTEEMLNQRVREVLYVKFWLGLFDEPYVKNPRQADKIVNCEKHRDLALQGRPGVTGVAEK